MTCTDVTTLFPLYLSGELDGPRAAAFAAHLETCPVCAREVAHQREFDARLRTGVLAEEIDHAALDRRIREDIAATRVRPSASRWLATAAGVAAALLAAALGYRLLLPPGAPRACVDAAQDHRNEVIDRQRRPWLSDRAAVEALAQSRGVPAAVVGALTTSGYRFERGKLCRLDGLAFLHLVYTDGAQEFSVYLRQRDAPEKGPSGGPFAADLGPEHVASFETRGWTAMVVTDQSREVALRLSRFAAGVL